MRFIQVGVGAFGKGWLQRLIAHPRVEIAALVDTNPAALAAAGEEAGVDPERRFAALDEALERVDADALLCVTPPEHHETCAVKAMQAGLDVITEKPLAHTPASCTAIADAARETGRTCGVSQNYRYRPAPWTLRRLVADGTLGAVGQASIDFFRGVDFGGGFRHVMDYPVLVDMAIHHFDLLRFVTGLNAVSVRGEAWNPPWSNYRGDCSSSLVFEMENGTRSIYNASWCAKGQFCNWDGNWRIEGDQGSVTCREEGLVLRRVPGLYTVTETEAMTPQGPPLEGQDFVLDDFMTAVEQSRRPATDVLDNMYSIGMVFAAVEAVKTEKRVFLKEVFPWME